MNDVSPNNLDREHKTLPYRWAWATPLEIGDSALGKMLDRAKHTEGHALPYVRNLNVRWGTFDLSDLLTMRFRDGELARYGLRRGDLLICEGGEPGRCAVWNQDDPNIKYQKAVHRLRLFEGVDPYYIMYQIMHDAWRGWLVQFFTGSTIKHFTGESLRKLQLRIAPSNEQQRIVAKIDELFSELDAGVASLKRARALLKRYRQAVLKAAVTGELTRAWRERHQGEISESGAELLQRILKARRQAWEAAELKKLQAKGKPPKDDRWKQKYKEPQPPDTTARPALPEGWVWATLLQISSRVTDGTHQSPDFAPSGIPFIIINDVTSGRIDWRNVSKWVTRRTFEVCTERCRPERGDVLYTAVGSYGTAVEVATEREFMFQRHIAHIKPIREQINPAYLALVLNSPMSLRRAHKVARGVAQKTVTLGELAVFPVPVPPFAEQETITAEAERLMSVIDALESELALGFRRNASLRQSILKAAFSGKLVPQDPDDEPASVLLERIRAERAAKPKPARGRWRKVEAGARQLELLE